MGYTQRLDWEAMRSIDSATFTGSYQNLGTPLANPAYKLKIINNSTVAVTVSNDGINDKDIVVANSFIIYDEGVTGQNGTFPAVPEGTQIMVKGAAGVGSVYLVVQYVVQS
jgi:hypothetical protein